MEKILLFIPGYNCEKQITRTLAKLDEKVLPWLSEVIMVNNRSTDGTEQAVINYTAVHPELPLKLLRNDENYGLGGSHKVAFNYAIENGFDYVVVLHGDDQADIHDIIPILKDMTYKKYDCCLGARFKKGSKLIGYSKIRTFGNRVYDLMFSVLCGRRIYDLGSGLNMYCVKMLENRFYIKFPDNLTFNYCMVLALRFYNQNSLFFSISWRETDQFSNVKLFNQAFKVLNMLLKALFKKQTFMNSEMRKCPEYCYTAKVIMSNCNYGEL